VGTAGVYLLTLGELAVDNLNLSIANTSGGAVVIDGNLSSRVLNLGASAAARVSVSGITVRRGRSTTGILDQDFGGGFLVGGGSALTLVESTLSENQGTFGGGVFTGGALTITNSVLADNQATRGGAIYGALGGSRYHPPQPWLGVKRRVH
jgi:hypothetical protein